MVFALDRYQGMDTAAFLELKVIKVLKHLTKEKVNLLGVLVHMLCI